MKRSIANAAPTVGHARAMIRFFKDREASVLGKIFVGLVAVYVVFPFDLVPDVIPIVGWLDDLGLATVALWYLAHVSSKYRTSPPLPDGEPNAKV